MATLALHAELAEMNVVVAMTGGAVGGHFHLSGRAAMAFAAGELDVFASQRKFRLAVVVEFPDAPGVRRMAGRTVSSESTAVNIAAAMACETIVRRAFERARHMALAATDEHVHT